MKRSHLKSFEPLDRDTCVIVYAFSEDQEPRNKDVKGNLMGAVLSDRAQAFLKEDHFAVLSTLNRDGSSQLTTMWYLLDDDGRIVMNSLAHLQKVKNLRRDPRFAICVEDGNRYVSINGTVEIIEDQETVHRDIYRLSERYIKDEERRRRYIATFVEQQRVAFRLTCEKVTEFFA
jgi:PPOX class probable F420-dependent enzyme